MDVFDLCAKISLDSSQYNSALSSAGDKLSSLGSLAKKGAGLIAKVTAGGVATAAAGVTALTKSAVDNYAEYEQLVGGVETLFKNSASKVEKYASNAFKTAGMSANEYMDTVTSFSASLISSVGGDTEKAAEKANQAITDMSDNANKMGTDVESIQTAYQGFAKQNYSMLDNLKLGYGGTQSEMYRLLQDAAELDDTFAKTADFSLDEKGHLTAGYSDIVDAIHIVQTNMGITGTTAKEASTTIEGSVNSMKSAWTNLVTGLGDSNADIGALIDDLVETIIGKDGVGGVVNNITPVIKQAIGGIGSVIEGLAPVIGTEVPALVGDILPSLLSASASLVSSVVSALPSLLSTIADTIVSAAPDLWNTVVTIFTTLITAGTSLAEPIIENLQSLWSQIMTTLDENLPGLLEKVATIFTNITSYITENIPVLLQTIIDMVSQVGALLLECAPTILNLIPTLFLDLVEICYSNLPVLINTAAGIVNTIGTQLPKLMKAITKKIPGIIKGIIKIILKYAPKIAVAGFKLLVSLIKNLPAIIATIVTALPSVIVAIVKGIIEAVPDMIKAGGKLLKGIGKGLLGALDWLKEKIKGLKEKITEKFKGMNLLDIGKNLIKGLWNGIKSVKDWIFDKISGFCSGITKKVKKLFGINSPSKVFAQIGDYCAQGFINGISALANYNVSSELQSIIDGAYNTIDSTITGMTSATTSTAASTSTTLSSSTKSKTSTEEKSVKYQQQTAEKMNDILSYLEAKLTKENLQKNIYLDTGTLVGTTVEKMDAALGKLKIAKGRGR